MPEKKINNVKTRDENPANSGKCKVKVSTISILCGLVEKVRFSNYIKATNTTSRVQSNMIRLGGAQCFKETWANPKFDMNFGLLSRMKI